MKVQLLVVTTPLKCIPCCPRQVSYLEKKIEIRSHIYTTHCPAFQHAKLNGCEWHEDKVIQAEQEQNEN